MLMNLAIQENLLSGETFFEKFRFEGKEIWRREFEHLNP